jgi:hypothetical protein
MLIGLACGVRSLRLFADNPEWIISTYGAMIQSIIDDESV